VKVDLYILWILPQKTTFLNEIQILFSMRPRSIVAIAADYITVYKDDL